MKANQHALSFRLTVFFCVNPLAMLTTAEIAELFDVNVLRVPDIIRGAVANELFICRSTLKTHTAGRPPNIYGAGPKLLRMIVAADGYVARERRLSKDEVAIQALTAEILDGGKP
jgi:hypothetical protein